jgi:hypothetical protein
VLLILVDAVGHVVMVQDLMEDHRISPVVIVLAKGVLVLQLRVEAQIVVMITLNVLLR